MEGFTNSQQASENLNNKNNLYNKSDLFKKQLDRSIES